MFRYLEQNNYKTVNCRNKKFPSPATTVKPLAYRKGKFYSFEYYFLCAIQNVISKMVSCPAHLFPITS